MYASVCHLKHYFAVTAVISLILTLPVLFWEVWAYIKPGLYENEQKIGKKYFPIILVLFCLGCLFAYFILFPIIVSSMLHFSIHLGLNPIITLNDYLHLMIWIVMMFGVIFQFPLLLFFLAKIGWIKAQQLRKKRKYAYFVILIIAGIISPPELISHLSMTIPLIFLYEISIQVISRLEKTAKKSQSLTTSNIK